MHVIPAASCMSCMSCMSFLPASTVLPLSSIFIPYFPLELCYSTERTRDPKYTCGVRSSLLRKRLSSFTKVHIIIGTGQDTIKIARGAYRSPTPNSVLFINIAN